MNAGEPVREFTDQINTCLKHVKIRVFSDLYFPIHRQNVRFYRYAEKYGPEKVRKFEQKISIHISIAFYMSTVKPNFRCSLIKDF